LKKEVFMRHAERGNKVFSLLIIGLLLAAIGGGLSGCKKSAPGGDDDVIKLTYANFPPAPTFPCVQMERWADEIEERTEGKIKVETFPGGTLLGAKDMMDGVEAGSADIGCLCMAYQPGRFTITNAVSLPLGIPDALTGTKVLMDVYENYKPESFGNVKVLALFTTAPSNIMSQKAIRTLEDAQGVNIRASGGAAQILKAWGANAVGMPMSDAPDALQKGTISGIFSSLEVMKDFNYAEYCPFVTMTDAAVYPFAVVMNKEKWDSLPADIQRVMDEMFVEQSHWTGSYMDGHVQESIDWSKENHGVEFIELDGVEKMKWNAKLEPIVSQWVEDVSGKGLDGKEMVGFLEGCIKKNME
jgi:TRAP-type C4-dicarboxylate transport system substrate-binding protein